jgi:2-polyprenyl-3-methyl-5-hydroxy-6-metoxy-1,4-benzoquinol methylase
LSIAPSKPDRSSEAPLECPLCGSRSTFLVREQLAAPVIERWRQQHGADVSGYFCALDSFQECRCRDCGIRFFIPASVAGQPALYEQLANSEYYRATKWEYQAALADLDGAKNLLEIGCGYGDFLALVARQTGATATGLEQNDIAVREARHRGLNVRRGDIREIAPQFAGQYDAVCLFQVLEHLPDPGAFLHAACTALRPGGRLILAVPNAASFLRHAWNILDMPPHHMTRWQPSVMAQLQRLLPLELLHVRREPLADYHVSDYIEAYFSAWSQKPGLWALSHPRVKAIAVGLIRHSGLRRFLRGHTLYACFARR